MLHKVGDELDQAGKVAVTLLERPRHMSLVPHGHWRGQETRTIEARRLAPGACKIHDTRQEHVGRRKPCRELGDSAHAAARRRPTAARRGARLKSLTNRSGPTP